MKSSLIALFLISTTVGALSWELPTFGIGRPISHYSATYCRENPKVSECLLKGPGHHDYIDMTNGNQYHWDEKLHGFYPVAHWPLNQK